MTKADSLTEEIAASGVCGHSWARQPGVPAESINGELKVFQQNDETFEAIWRTVDGEQNTARVGFFRKDRVVY